MKAFGAAYELEKIGIAPEQPAERPAEIGPLAKTEELLKTEQPVENEPPAERRVETFILAAMEETAAHNKYENTKAEDEDAGTIEIDIGGREL
ncbi:hypothetical protein EJ02DRAFT_456755 [Clathrospora elynae]|uniref:Uncharacterized protein n=1 Tax=Clathrospora elynae TaxID=706981 RepID=A0A6A5SG79_9PLEO|nr:hypothetical protein EJ02DRAFT_456755 [Clathrospora elynae]